MPSMSGFFSSRKLDVRRGVRRLAGMLDDADAVVIGAGAGLSTAAGLTYSGERFERYYPFWQLTARNPRAFYACVNLGEAFCPREIAERSVCVDADINDVLDALGV